MVYEDIGFQENILHSAIKSGSKGAFNNVLASLKRRLTDTEVRYIYVDDCCSQLQVIVIKGLADKGMSTRGVHLTCLFG